MTTDKAIEILSKRNYLCGECPFSGPDCQGCRLAEALDLAINALRKKADISNRALDLIDDLKDRGVINNRQRGTLRRAIILGDNNGKPPALVLTEINRPHGEWTNKLVDLNYAIVGTCSICNKRTLTGNFCRNCGADMRGDVK